MNRETQVSCVNPPIFVNLSPEAENVVSCHIRCHSSSSRSEILRRIRRNRDLDTVKCSEIHEYPRIPAQRIAHVCFIPNNTNDLIFQDLFPAIPPARNVRNVRIVCQMFSSRPSIRDNYQKVKMSDIKHLGLVK